MKKWAERDVEKPASHHESPSTEKNACHKLVNNKTLVKRKDNLCDTKRKPAPKKKTLVDTESTKKQCPIDESNVDASDIIDKTSMVCA
mgnify:CR=1 FL=1